MVDILSMHVKEKSQIGEQESEPKIIKLDKEEVFSAKTYTLSNISYHQVLIELNYVRYIYIIGKYGISIRLANNEFK